MDSRTAVDRTTEINLNFLVNHTNGNKTEEAESVMVDNFMDEVETFITLKENNTLSINLLDSCIGTNRTGW